jgi:hypothetical protein
MSDSQTEFENVSRCWCEKGECDYKRLPKDEFCGRMYDLQEQFEAVLLAWYQDDPVKVAQLCDEELDRSGALLGRIRYAKSNPTKEYQ